MGVAVHEPSLFALSVSARLQYAICLRFPAELRAFVAVLDEEHLTLCKLPEVVALSTDSWIRDITAIGRTRLGQGESQYYRQEQPTGYPPTPLSSSHSPWTLFTEGGSSLTQPIIPTKLGIVPHEVTGAPWRGGGKAEIGGDEAG